MINGEGKQVVTEQAVVRFGDIRIDMAEERVWRGGRPVDMPYLSYRLLAELVRSGPQPLSIKALSDRVWQKPVSGDAVKQRVKMLRQTLGDDASHPTYIENVRGYGYRLATPLHYHAELVGSPKRPFKWRLASAAVAAVLVCTLTVLGFKDSFFADRSAEHLVQFATLPIVPIGSNNWTEVLAAGIDSELKNVLAELPILEIVSLPVGQIEAGFDLAEIASQFGVDILLMGAVRYDIDTSRVVFELINCKTQKQIAVQAFDLEPGINLENQKRLTEEVADFVVRQLTASS